jgi:hypothetical protein
LRVEILQAIAVGTQRRGTQVKIMEWLSVMWCQEPSVRRLRKADFAPVSELLRIRRRIFEIGRDDSRTGQAVLRFSLKACVLHLDHGIEAPSINYSASIQESTSKSDVYIKGGFFSPCRRAKIVHLHYMLVTAAISTTAPNGPLFYCWIYGIQGCQSIEINQDPSPLGRHLPCPLKDLIPGNQDQAQFFPATI